VEAINRARKVEGDIATFPMLKQAHYYIYRGASHLALGQMDEARYWLGYAVRMRASNPELIEGEHAEVLDRALTRLKQPPVAPPRPPSLRH
jgi:hypothetical protein